jgi:predicted component of type VI protein secretion system
MPGMMKKTPAKTERMVGYTKKTAAPKPKATPTAKSKATPTAKPKPSPSTFAQRNKAAEAEFKRLMDAGKIKDLTKTRKMIAEKYGVYPNGLSR